MRRKFLTLVFLCSIVSKMNAQLSAPDTIATQDPSFGPLVIQPVTHATFAITTNNLTIYVDPTGGANAFNGLKDPDMIFVTDIHGDHFDIKTIDAVKGSNTIIVVPKAVGDLITTIDKSRLVIMSNGETKTLNGSTKGNSPVTVKAIAMYNLPETADSKHIKGRGNGYVLTIAGKNIYISGDTEDIPEMRNLKSIDVAFVCMNLPYTMDINQAASAVLEFKPKIVYPYHYRGENGLSDVNTFKKMVNASNPQIDVRLKEWYPGR